MFKQSPQSLNSVTRRGQARKGVKPCTSAFCFSKLGPLIQVCLHCRIISTVWRSRCMARWHHWASPPPAQGDDAAAWKAYKRRHKVSVVFCYPGGQSFLTLIFPHQACADQAVPQDTAGVLVAAPFLAAGWSQPCCYTLLNSNTFLHAGVRANSQIVLLTLHAC